MPHSTLCPDYAAFGKMEMDTPYIHLHPNPLKSGCLRSFYDINVTTYGCIFVTRLVCLLNNGIIQDF